MYVIFMKNVQIRYTCICICHAEDTLFIEVIASTENFAEVILHYLIKCIVIKK